MRHAALVVTIAAATTHALSINRYGHYDPSVPIKNMQAVASSDNCPFAVAVKGTPTCQQIADDQNMSASAFQNLNPWLDCKAPVPDRWLVCVRDPPPGVDEGDAGNSTVTSAVGTATGTLVVTGTTQATATAVASSNSTSSSVSSTYSLTSTSVTSTASPIESPEPPSKTTTQPPPPPKTTEAPQPPPKKTTQPPAPPPQTTQAPKPNPPSGDPCGYITSLVNSNQDSSSGGVVNLHNQIRSYVNSVRGMNLPMVHWDDSVAYQAQVDAQWSVDHTSCQAGGLAHNPDFGVTGAKNLGWSNYWYAMFQFVTYDDGGGSECQQWFNGGGLSHFGNMMQGGSRVGCGAANCPGGQFGPVIGCDYAG